MSKTSTGLDNNVAAGLCYVFGWLSGLIFLLIEKEDQDVRFHAMQSVIVFGGLTLLNIVLSISLIGIPLIPLLGVIGLVQQRADLDRGGVPGGERIEQVPHGEPGIDDILHDQDIFVFDGVIEVGGDLDHTTRGRFITVA